MVKTSVKSHPRRGTKGVKRHSRNVSGSMKKVRSTFSSEEQKRIANTIKQQIGFDTLAYVGANQFMYGEDDGKPYLQFKASGSKIQRGGRIRVLYDAGQDLYNVELWRVNMRAKEPVKRLRHAEGVYAENLRSVIEGYTG
jgi:hypothetical protein